MPLYVADYLRDTMHLTTELHGAYMLLLMASWSRGGRLPNDPFQLAGMTKMSPAAWRRVAPVILPFFQIEGSELSHKRVVMETEKAERMADARRQNGTKGGRPRKQDVTEQEPGTKPNGNLEVKLDETPTRVAPPSPSPLPSEGIELKLSLNGVTAVAYSVDFDVWWTVYPRKVGKLAASKAYTKARKAGASAEALMDAVVKATWPREAQFIPHPATWLNEGRWMDVAPAAPELQRVGFV